MTKYKIVVNQGKTEFEMISRDTQRETKTRFPGTGISQCERRGTGTYSGQNWHYEQCEVFGSITK